MNQSKIKKTISNLGKSFNADERETSILFDHTADVVHLETTHPATARRWYKYFEMDDEVKFDGKADSLKMTVPVEYCRNPDLILLPRHRKVEQTAEAVI